MSKSNISRPDFLKLGGYGLMGMFLPNLSLNPPTDIFDTLQGRVIDRILWAYEKPDRKSKRKKLYWHDLVFRITSSTVSEDETAYNRVWYETEDGGYVYSGSVQPVRTVLNEPQLISLKGALGEVSVPFTDAHLEGDPNSETVYRLYYETVHWVTASAVRPDGSIWFTQEHRIPYALVRLLNSWKCKVAAFIPVIRRKGPAALMMLAAQGGSSLSPAIGQPYASMAELIGTALEKVIALQSMEKRLNELQMINEVSQTISIQTDLDVLYEVIHRATTQIMGDVSFLIALYDPDDNRIQIPYMVEEWRRVSIDPFPLGEGLTSILIKTSRPLMLVEDTENRARALERKAFGCAS